MSTRNRGIPASDGPSALRSQDPDPCEETGANEVDRAGEEAAPRLALRLDVAVYIESMSAELRQMARSANLDALAYFLEMARLESSLQITRHASEAQG